MTTTTMTMTMIHCIPQRMVVTPHNSHLSIIIVLVLVTILVICYTVQYLDRVPIAVIPPTPLPPALAFNANNADIEDEDILLFLSSHLNFVVRPSTPGSKLSQRWNDVC
jgi:hypothetical protein